MNCKKQNKTCFLNEELDLLNDECRSFICNFFQNKGTIASVNSQQNSDKFEKNLNENLYFQYQILYNYFANDLIFILIVSNLSLEKKQLDESKVIKS